MERQAVGGFRDDEAIWALTKIAGVRRPWWPFTNERDYREFQDERQRGERLRVEFVKEGECP